MLFLGTTFFSCRNTIDPTLIRTNDIGKIVLNEGEYDQVYASRNPDMQVTDNLDEWNYDSIMNATFDNGSLDAGNSGFSLRDTDYVVVKCREVGTFDWTTIYYKKINTLDDFKIHIKDYYRKSRTNYEYMTTSVCNGVENSYVLTEVYSEYDGVYICDKNNIYGTLFDLDYADTTIDTSATVQTLLNSKYPIVTKNGMAHYESGNISASFIKFDQETNTVNLPSGLAFRENVKTWLDNKKPKILKFYDGRIWLINVNGTISDQADGHNDKRKLSFDWVEIGDVNDMETLYNNDLSDVGKEWWY